ncbi:MAG: Uncharacterized oxidoreductase, partial [uncultured Pseudonocardia sp.]
DHSTGDRGRHRRPRHGDGPAAGGDRRGGLRGAPRGGRGGGPGGVPHAAGQRPRRAAGPQPRHDGPGLREPGDPAAQRQRTAAGRDGHGRTAGRRHRRRRGAAGGPAPCPPGGGPAPRRRRAPGTAAGRRAPRRRRRAGCLRRRVERHRRPDHRRGRRALPGAAAHRPGRGRAPAGAAGRHRGLRPAAAGRRGRRLLRDGVRPARLLRPRHRARRLGVVVRQRPAHRAAATRVGLARAPPGAVLPRPVPGPRDHRVDRCGPGPVDDARPAPRPPLAPRPHGRPRRRRPRGGPVVRAGRVDGRRGRRAARPVPARPVRSGRRLRRVRGAAAPAGGARRRARGPDDLDEGRRTGRARPARRAVPRAAPARRSPRVAAPPPHRLGRAGGGRLAGTPPL